jgi:glucosamine--fructose-6-phosphate aminotransferase (isomerizing)
MADLFLQEILEQPEALRSTCNAWLDGTLARRLGELLAGKRPSLVLMTGMGSSLDACYPASAFLSSRGLRSAVIETSELIYCHAGLLGAGSLLVVVTQSGESAEPVRLVETLGGIRIVSVTNGLDNSVARRSTLALDLAAGVEKTVSTKTYVSTLVALVALARALAGEPEAAFASEVDGAIGELERLLAARDARVAPLVDAVQACRDLQFVARGPSLATAHEAALILKEAARRPAEAVSGGHFRHGPLELVSERGAYVLFAGAPATRPLMLRLARDIARWGGRVVWVGPEGDEPARVALEERDPYLLPVLEIVPIQLLAWSLARSEGRTIDGFEKLTKVTRTE